MTVQDKIDTKFLKDTVADVVVKACSACAVARPEDPVGFVAGWLDQFVANDAILKKRAVELTERAAVEAEEEKVRRLETRARLETATRASRRRYAVLFLAGPVAALHGYGATSRRWRGSRRGTPSTRRFGSTTTVSRAGAAGRR